MSDEKKFKSWQEFWLALAGVLVPSLLLSLLVYFNWMIYKAGMLGLCPL